MMIISSLIGQYIISFDPANVLLFTQVVTLVAFAKFVDSKL